jgi:guanylate kinase
MNISQQEISKQQLCDYIVENKDGKLDKTVEKVKSILAQELSA